MIDPITALAGIQSAVALIKKVSKTVDDVSSLGPVLGKYFDAKNNASKAMVTAKNSGNKSAMATAIEIEMALHQTEQFERQLQLLFMQTGKIDVWNKIKARQAEMDRDDAIAMRKLKDAEKKKKEEEDFYNEIGIAIGAVFFLLFIVFVGVNEAMEYCAKARCGR